MKTLLAAFAAVSLLAVAAPAFANPIDDWISGLPGSHVGHISPVDNPGVPNCTLASHPAGCENVPTFFVTASVGSNGECATKVTVSGPNGPFNVCSGNAE